MKTNLIYVNERITLTALPGGQAFGTDSYMLAAYAGTTSEAALELGSGTGVCSLLLADRNKASHIYAIEIQGELHSAGVYNFESNKMSDRITAICKDLREIGTSDFDKPVGMVIANPPYFLKGSGIQSPDMSKNAARFELNGGIYDFAAAASRILYDGGKFYTVMRPERLRDLDRALRGSGFALTRRTFVLHKPGAEPSMVLTEAQKGGNDSNFTITRPLILRFDNGEFTEDANKIYETCSFGEFLK